MGDFVTNPVAPVLFADKAAAPSVTRPPGWVDANTLKATEANALRDATLDIRAVLRPLVYTDAGALPVVATGSTTARTAAQRAADVYNVKDYGARGDGATDDTAAIQACISAAAAAGAGVVALPAATYRTTATLSLPLATNGRFVLDMTGSTLAYEGAGYALEAAGAAQAYANLTLRGGRVVGTSAGLAGLRLRTFNKGRIEGTSFEGFASGDGILNEGANAVVLVDVQCKGNRVGLRNKGLLDAALDPLAYQGNAFTVLGGHFAFNSLWGYHSDGTGSEGGARPNICNQFLGTTFEYNGTTGTGGHAKLEASTAEGFVRCYFEDSSSVYGQAAIVLGDATYTARDTQVLNCWFGTRPTGTTLRLVRAVGAHIWGNSEAGAVTNFVDADATSSNIAMGPNAALAATNYKAGAGTFAYIFTTSGALTLAGNLTGGNVLRSSNTAQGLFYASNDTILRSATGGTTRLQDQAGTTQAEFSTTATVLSSDVRLGNSSAPRITHGSAAPTTGTWTRGSLCHNSAAAVGSPKAWRCTVAGTPGTWVSEGNL